MKSTKWKKWRLSKYLFPTFLVKGSGSTKGALVVGRTAAKAFLVARLGHARVDAMKTADTRREWIFMEPLNV